MQRAHSPQFPYEKYSTSKQTTFSTSPFSTKKESPLRTHSHKPNKSQQSSQPLSRQQTLTSPKRTLPPPHHAILRKKDEEMQRHNSAMRSFGGPVNNATMHSTFPNALSQSFSPNRAEAKLQDLCNEDKQKIGDLIKKLAEEKEEKERLRKELESRDGHYSKVINNLAKENDEIVKDSIELQSQFKYSLELLKNFQDHAMKQHKDKSKEAKKQRKLEKQKEEEYRQQMLLKQQEEERRAKEREKEKEMEKRRYEQEQQKREYLLQQQKAQQQELQRLQQLQYQQQHELKSQQQKHPMANPSPGKRNMSSPIVKAKENPYFADEPRQLIPIEAGKTELELLHKNLTQRIKSPAKAAADATFEKEQGVMTEIAKLRKDIEDLTHSFKKINFSPADSQNVKDNHPTEASTQKQKSSSPIKFVQDLKPTEGYRKNPQQQRRQMEEDELYEEPLQPEVLPVQPEKRRETPNRAAGMRKGASASMSTANVPQRYEPSSTSSDDEFEVMQKWLNMRKDKIQKITQELNEHRVERGKDVQKGRYNVEKQDTVQSEHYPGGEVDDYYYSEQKSQKQSVDQQTSQQDWTGERGEGLYQQKGWTKTSPSMKGLSSGKFNSTKKKDSYSFQDQDSMRRGMVGSPRMNETGVVNLNQLSLNDMIQLKNVLEEKIHNEKPQQDLIGSKLEYAIRSPQKAHSIMNPLNSQTFSYQATTYPELSKSGSSAKNSRLMESGYNQQERFGKSGLKTLPSEGLEYERRSDYKGSSKKEFGDSTLVRDFDSIAYTRPDNYDGFELVTEVPKTLEDDNSQLVDEKLYDEKLREFLKIQERMLKQNKIREQGVHTEGALKNKFADLRRPNNISKTQNSAQRSGYTNSPPSVRSVEKMEPQRSNDKDYTSSQNTDYIIRGQQSNQARFFKEGSPVENLEEAKTPDYGYGVSQRSIRTTPPRASEGENRDQVGQLTDDFYDDGLFELVDDIELKESAKPTPNNSIKPEFKSTSRTKEMKSVENEFNSLFNTVRSMFTNNNDDNTTTERIREKLLNKMDKSDLMTSKLSSEGEDDSSYINLPQQVLGRGNERRTSDLSGHRTHGRPSKTDSSLVETDTSILAITKKVDELKKNKRAQL